jgi:uncharacterized protein (DUF1919 family)
MKKIREYKLRLGGTKIIAPITKILSVQEVDGEIRLWAETNRAKGNHLFIFITVGSDFNVEKIPHFDKAKYLNTVVLGENKTPYHIYFFHQPGEQFLQREQDAVKDAFFDAIFDDEE